MQSSGEGIAQITDENVANMRQVARNDEGLPILEKLPSRFSRLFMNKAGDEVWVPLVNHRIYTEYSYKEYGRDHVERLVAAGFLPKDECPLSTKWSHIVGGDGALMRAQQGEHACRIEPAQTKSAGWHGCEHYQRAKQKRREKAKQKVAADKKMTVDEIDAIARYMKAQALSQAQQPPQPAPQPSAPPAPPPVEATPSPPAMPEEPAAPSAPPDAFHSEDGDDGSD